MKPLLLCCFIFFIGTAAAQQTRNLQTNRVLTPADPNKLKLPDNFIPLTVQLNDFMLAEAAQAPGLYENTCKVNYYYRTPSGSPVIVGRPQPNGIVHLQVGSRPGKFIGRQFFFNTRDNNIQFSLAPGFLYNTSINDLLITSQDYCGTDNHLLKLKNGSILALRMGITRRELADKPSWWGVKKMQTDGGNPFIDKPNQRGAGYFFTYDVQQNAWQPPAPIFDNAVELNGDFGAPRLKTDEDGEVLFSTFYIGGMDRPELYQDPWTGRLYLSAWGAGGVNDPKNNTNLKPEDRTKLPPHKVATFVLYSDNLGTTWNVLKRDENVVNVPVVMTSTRDGRFFAVHESDMFGPNGAITVRYTLKSNPQQFAEAVLVDKNGTGDLLCTDSMAYLMDKSWVPQISICRVGNSTTKSAIRIAYNAVDKKGRQYIKTGLLVVNSDAPGDYQFTPGITLKAPAGYSALYPTFIEADVSGNGDAQDIHALYWVESSISNYATYKGKENGTSSKKASAHYCVFSGAGDNYRKGYLSVTNGQKREWGNAGYVSQGDYFTGGSFLAGGYVNFLAQWSEPDGIKGNLISVPLPRKRASIPIATQPKPVNPGALQEPVKIPPAKRGG